MPADFVFLNVLCICLLGFFTSYTDLRKGLIENRVVFPAILIAFALSFLNQTDFAGFFVNGLFALLFGLILWFAKLWTAGDSKLFLAFALLFPLSLYQETALFPSFSIIINSFVPAFAALLALVLLRTSREEKKQAFISSFRPEAVFSVAVFLFSLSWVVFHIFSIFSVRLDFFSTTIVLFLLVLGLETLFPKKTVIVFFLISLFFFAVHFNQVVQLDFVLQFVFWLLLFLFLVFFAIRLGLSAFGKKTLLKDLRPGMVLLDSVVEKGSVLKRLEPFYPSMVNILFGAREKRLISSGQALTEKQVRALKKRHSLGQTHFNMLLVQETLPFAPILFIGVLLTFLFAAFL